MVVLGLNSIIQDYSKYEHKIFEQTLVLYFKILFNYQQCPKQLHLHSSTSIWEEFSWLRYHPQ